MAGLMNTGATPQFDIGQLNALIAQAHTPLNDTGQPINPFSSYMEGYNKGMGKMGETHAVNSQPPTPFMPMLNGNGNNPNPQPPNPGMPPANSGGSSQQGGGASTGTENSGATPVSVPETNPVSETPQNPMGDNNFALGLMMGGMGLQGQNPMEVLKGLMSSKLAQQEYMGQKPITKYEKASLAQNQIKILRDTKKDELTNITDQMKQIESKVGGLHGMLTKEPWGPSQKQWDSLYQLAQQKRVELEQLDSRLTGEGSTQQPSFPKNAKPGDKINIGGQTYEYRQ